MLAKTYSYGISGLEAFEVAIEVDVSGGLPATIIVGLPDSAIKESKERVRSAIRNSGYKFKPKRVTVNLSPADTKKEGPSFDLAICLGILAASDQIPSVYLNQYAILGELSLDGKIQPISGVLSIAMSMSNSSLKGIILPYANAQEAAVVKSVPVYPVTSLADAINFLNNPKETVPYKLKVDHSLPNDSQADCDFSDVKGQMHVKRGLEIAAAGGHNCLLIGPPGSGKSMLAKRLPTILPDMSLKESLETSKIHSIMGLLNSKEGIMDKRPFRSPHHTTSDVAIVGGGSHPKPGEVTLSHNGVLFLDELPEFNRNVLESLRQPLEDHYVTISRANKTSKFPSKFMMISSMNPCPCGWYTEPKKECHCSPNQIHRYMSKISGPLLDRIDLHIEVPALPSSELLVNAPSEKSETIKTRTVAARDIQLKRFVDSTIFANAFMNHRQIKKYCHLDNESKRLLKSAIEDLGLSARSYDKILKVARTIADLERKDNIETDHIAEAIQYRCLDRNWWS